VAVPTAVWVGLVHPEITPPSNFHQLRDTTAATGRILGAAILGIEGDEAIHGILNMMHAGASYRTLQWAVPIHPTVSELIPTLMGDLKPE